MSGGSWQSGIHLSVPYLSEHKNKCPEDPDSSGSSWESLTSVSIRTSVRRILTVRDPLESPLPQWASEQVSRGFWQSGILLRVSYLSEHMNMYSLLLVDYMRCVISTCLRVIKWLTLQGKLYCFKFNDTFNSWIYYFIENNRYFYLIKMARILLDKILYSKYASLKNIAKPNSWALISSLFSSFFII